MSGDAADGGPVWRLGLLLYPVAAAAVAINLFLAGLMGQAMGLQALSPQLALILSVPLGLPASWAAGGRERGLIGEAQ